MRMVPGKRSRINVMPSKRAKVVDARRNRLGLGFSRSCRFWWLSHDNPGLPGQFPRSRSGPYPNSILYLPNSRSSKTDPKYSDTSATMTISIEITVGSGVTTAATMEHTTIA